MHTEEGRIVFGEMDGGISERVKSLEEVFRQGGVPAEASSNIRAILWGKLVWNAAFNALNTLVGGGVRVLVERPETRGLARQVMEEVRSVAVANGVALPADLVERLLRWTDTAAIEMKTSTRQDLEAGKPLEVDALNGAVVRKGQATGVPTPYNFTLYALLEAINPACRGPAS